MLKTGVVQHFDILQITLPFRFIKIYATILKTEHYLLSNESHVYYEAYLKIFSEVRTHHPQYYLHCILSNLSLRVC